jgi:signal transduction histidine kinase
VERVVSAGRLVLAAFLCLALLLDPSEPARHAEVVRAMATGYMAYALALVAWAWLGTTTLGGLAIATHVTDLVLFALLMHLSDGPTSPFFVYFVFATLCGAIRWHGRGALVTGFVALALYVTVTAAGARFFGTGTLDGLRFVTRCAHLATIAALLAYLGAHHHRLERELGSLARWPRRPAAGEEEGLRALLAHAAATLGARRVVLVWEEHDEPWLRVAQQDGAAFQVSSEAPDTFGEIVDGLTASFVCEDVARQPQARALVRTDTGFHHSPGVLLSPQFLKRFPVRSVHATRICDDSVQGWLLAFDKTAMSIDDLVLGDIVGHFVAGALELEVRLEQLRERAASEERLRLARDLHDGVLQALTAAALQVQAARDVLHLDVAAAEERLARVQDTVFAEQQAIRRAVETLDPRSVRVVSRVDSLAPLRECVRAVARQWDLRVRLDVSGSSPVPQHVVHEICRMATEALVNAARHGAASDATVVCETSAVVVGLIVEYQGRGFVGLDGRHDLASLSARGQGPRTLMQRVAALEGSLCIESRTTGARLEIEVPLQGPRRSARPCVVAAAGAMRERVPATPS